MPEPYRTAASMRFLDDLPPRAIARQLGVEAAVVRQRVHRGLAMLRERLDAECGGRPAWLSVLAPFGLGVPTAGPLLLLPVLAMKKVALAALVLLAAVAWWLVVPSPGDADQRTAGADAPSLAKVPAAPAAELAAPMAAAGERIELACAVRVVDAEGRPLDGADVQCWRTDGTRMHLSTDSDGRCAFAASEESGGVHVSRFGFVPVVQPLPKLRGVHEVVLGAGSSVSGRVLVDGRPAPPGVYLRLTLPPLVVPAGVPRTIAESLGQGDTSHCYTDKDGCFSFAGLGTNWSGELQITGTHWFVPRAGQVIEGDNTLILMAPQRDLLVETTRLPQICGRMLWSEDGGPAAGALVMLNSATLADGTRMSTPGARTDAEGAFTLSLYPSQPEQHARWLVPESRSPVVRLILHSFTYGKVLTVENGGDPIDLAQEFVLRVDRPQVVWFKAVDADGKPIAGARAVAYTGELTEPTDVGGLGWCHHYSPQHDLDTHIGAAGRQVVSLCKRKDMAATRTDPVVVVLPPCNGLRVHLRAPDGTQPPGCFVSWCGKQPLYRGPMGMPSELERHFGCSTAAWGGGNAMFRGDALGAVLLHSIAPEVAGTVLVVDGLGTELVRQDLTTPPLGEVRELVLEVGSRPRQVHGRVVSAGGVPAAQVNLELSAGVPQQTLTTRSAGDGTFSFAPVHAAKALKLVARRRGLAAVEREIAAGEADREIVLSLAGGRVTTLAILDDTGAVVGDLRPEVKTATNVRIDLQMTERGEYVCTDLPPGEVTFACVIGGQRFELRHDTAEPRAELRVPRPARAIVTAPDGWPWPREGKLIAVFARSGTDGEPVRVDLTGRGDPPHLFLPGRYRVALELMTWNVAQERVYAEQGPVADVELRAGETMRVQLR